MNSINVIAVVIEKNLVSPVMCTLKIHFIFYIQHNYVIIRIIITNTV